MSSDTFREELNKRNLTMFCGGFSQNQVVFYVHNTQPKHLPLCVHYLY